MKENIVKIEQLAALLFAEKSYNKFISYIEKNQITEARIMIDMEIKKYELEKHSDSYFEHYIADKLQDFIMDLIINEIDEGKKNKQIKSNTG